MEWNEVQSHMMKSVEDFRFDHTWKKVLCHTEPVGTHNRGIGIVLGITADDRKFSVWMIFDPEDLNQKAIKNQVWNALMTLDTYLDDECKCVPGVFLFVENPCEYHKEIFSGRYCVKARDRVQRG